MEDAAVISQNKPLQTHHGTESWSRQLCSPYDTEYPEETDRRKGTALVGDNEQEDCFYDRYADHKEVK